MSDRSTQRNQAFVIAGLGVALLVAVLLSPFASPNPDGLDRVAQDHQFDTKAHTDTVARKLPFHSIFNEYAARGVPEAIATPIAGLVGTLVTFGVAWGIGKLVVKGHPSEEGSNGSNTPDRLS